jgi:hypothetical protein
MQIPTLELSRPTARHVARRRRARDRRRRLATSLAFAALFVAGTALSAGAGDASVKASEDETTTASTEAVTPTASETSESSSVIPPEPSGGGEPVAEDASVGSPPAEALAPGGEPTELPNEPAAPETSSAVPVPDPGSGPAAESPAEPPAEAAPAEAPASGADPAPAPTAPAQAPADAPTGTPHVVEHAGATLVQPHAHAHDTETRAVDPESETVGTLATVWLHRALPDPTPPAKRISPAFARLLRSEARRARIDWAVLMGAIRADGHAGRNPARRAYVRELARALAARISAGEWHAFFALRNRTRYADRARALTRYSRAVGLRALVIGLDAAKQSLEDRVLADRRIAISGAGRVDIAAHRIDVRVLVLLRYLAAAHGQVTVSSLQSGHRLYARPGVISAHVYGLAVDVAALGGQPILGSSAPGGLTEQAVRSILLLPAEIRPQQVISLLGLGGRSFPLASHADHIHVGF